jgi:menaquinone-9 beta-reductase
MTAGHFDALVVGAGPAGSIAATVLAGGGARVALVDKAKFPRDKACGDLVGPRGVQLLTDLGITIRGAIAVGDMNVVGPTTRRVRLPCFPGRTYPGHALALPRIDFDAALQQAAVEAGAEPFMDRAADRWADDGLDGFALSTGTQLRADIIIGADGASSRVAAAGDLVEPGRVLWGFAMRAYVDERVDLPHIVLWEPTPWRAFPGYGWMFPGPDGRANLGLGLGTLSTREGAATAARELPAFVRTLRGLGLLGGAAAPTRTLGGWLKLGMVGTNPARGRVLLVGDAAGLVNPLHGEGSIREAKSGSPS